MRITAARLQPYALPLKAAWQSAAGTLTTRDGCLLRLETDAGCIGYGECAPLPSHGTEGPAASEQALHRWAASLPGGKLDDALSRLAAADTFATPAARSAVEMALLDLCAQAAGNPLARYLCPGNYAPRIPVNAMPGAAIGVGDAQIAATLGAGFGVIKLKVGVAAAKAEIAALHRIAQLLPAGTTLRLDANRAWTLATAARYANALAGLAIESIEEPLAQPTPEGLRELGRQQPFPIALDESWRQLAPDALFGNPPVARLILKLAPCGGLLPAFAVARRAAAAGMDCVVTTGVDSACATLAAAHLAAAIGNRLAHGLATSSWLAADSGQPPAIEGGSLSIEENPGLGFRPHAGVFG